MERYDDWKKVELATRQEEENVLKTLPPSCSSSLSCSSVSSSRPALYALHGKAQNMLEVRIDNRVLYI